jgi:DNA-binding MarR family transcriptional regulator
MAEGKTSRALQVVARALGRLGRERARAAGDVTPQQAEAMQLVAERGVLSTSEFAQLLGIDPSTASRNLAGLERTGYIVRRRGADDGRQTDVRLTSRGKRMAEAVSAEWTTACARMRLMHWLASSREIGPSRQPGSSQEGFPPGSPSGLSLVALPTLLARQPRSRLLGAVGLAALGVGSSTALSASDSRFLARELVRRARRVCCLASLASDLAHELAVHGGEPARALRLAFPRALGRRIVRRLGRLGRLRRLGRTVRSQVLIVRL